MKIFINKSYNDSELSCPGTHPKIMTRYLRHDSHSQMSVHKITQIMEGGVDKCTKTLLGHCIWSPKYLLANNDLAPTLKVIYHLLYGMNNYVLIWGDWLSCDPLRGPHDSQSPHIRKHLCPILWRL